MSSVTRVPATASLPASQLTGNGPVTTARHAGLRSLLKQSFVRFRYGDGFSHSRAIALQLALAVIPLVIAFVGLSTAIGTNKLGETLRRTLLTLTPGSGTDAVSRSLKAPSHGNGSQVALYAGLLTALLALTTAMGQVERGANRIYGVRRDHSGPVKYGRAVLLMLIGGIPALAGFLLVIAGGALADAVERVYGQGRTFVLVVRWPLGGLLMLLALSIIVARAPRRVQPGRAWLLSGASVALVLWLTFSLLLSTYLHSSKSFGTVYGPLTGVMALLLWCQLTALALLFGVAVGAHLEALRAGVQESAEPDPEMFNAPRRS